MPGQRLDQLTSTELRDALSAVDTLYRIEEYLDRGFFVKLSTLRADLEAQKEDRSHRKVVPISQPS